AASLGQLGTASTIQGETLTITLSSDVELLVNDVVNVVEPDIVAANGVLHKIDQVLLPSRVPAVAVAEPAPEAAAGTIPPTTPQTTTGTADTVALPTPTPEGGSVVTGTQTMTVTDEVVTDTTGITGTTVVTATDGVTDLASIITTTAEGMTIADLLAAR